MDTVGLKCPVWAVSYCLVTFNTLSRLEMRSACGGEQSMRIRPSTQRADSVNISSVLGWEYLGLANLVQKGVLGSIRSDLDDANDSHITRRRETDAKL